MKTISEIGRAALGKIFKNKYDDDNFRRTVEFTTQYDPIDILQKHNYDSELPRFDLPSTHEDKNQNKLLFKNFSNYSNSKFSSYATWSIFDGLVYLNIEKGKSILDAITENNHTARKNIFPTHVILIEQVISETKTEEDVTIFRLSHEQDKLIRMYMKPLLKS